MIKQRARLLRRHAAALLGSLALLAALPAGPAAAAEGQLRIAKQFGVVYLLLNVAEDQKLIEKHGKEAGLDIKVEYLQLSGGSAVNDALLSGSVDIGSAGVGPLFTLWDRTRGRQNVRGVASLGNFPYYLVSNRPEVKTIADLTDKDRIALPAVGVSVQARILQMASAKLWGDKDFARLDRNSVAVPPSRGGGRDHQGRHRDHGAFRQSAVPGAGTGREPERPRHPQLLRRPGRAGLLDRALRDGEIHQG